MAHEKGRLVAWNEPWGITDISSNPDVGVEVRLDVVSHAREADIVEYWKATHTSDKYKDATDADLLDEFMAVHWAWFVDE